MRLTKWNLYDIDSSFMTKTKNQEVLEEFLRSDMECAKLEGWTQKDASGCVNSLRQTIKNFKMHGVRVIASKGEVFLIREKENKTK